MKKLRSVPSSELSVDAVKLALSKNDLFDSYWNKNSKGCKHNYTLYTVGLARMVCDLTTGLMWQQGGSPEYMMYEKAQAYIEQLNKDRFAGFDNWRLPTLEEAMSLMEPKENSDGLYIAPVFDRNQSFIWTADSSSAGVVWVAFFYDGECGRCDVANSNSCFVRAVRDRT